MKHLATTLVAGGLLASSPLAQAEFSANVALATDYVFRGISQTGEDPALQGGFDFKHASGFYAGVWGSNVEFSPAVDDASLELDYYAGMTGEVGGGLGWDVGAIYYAYPGAKSDANLDYWEAKGALSYAFKGVTLEPSVSLALYYSPEFTGETGDATYVVGSLDLALPRDFGLSLHVGQQNIDETVPDSYVEYGVGISKELAGFGLALNYHGTNGDGEDLAGELADDRVVFSVSRSF